MTKLFDAIIAELQARVEQMKLNGTARYLPYQRNLSWPVSKKREIILKKDAAVELGNPKVESLSFLLWTEKGGLVRDGKITLIGPDIQETSEKLIPFGKIIIIGGSGFNGDNTYERFREMNLVRFDLALHGHMVRAVSHEMREWCRVSREALRQGFNLSVLGSSLMNRFKEIDYIDSVEIVFIMSLPEKIKAFREIGERTQRYIHAMRKMAEEMSMDCSSCDYQDICSDVEDLRAMRKALFSKRVKN